MGSPPAPDVPPEPVADVHAPVTDGVREPVAYGLRIRGLEHARWLLRTVAPELCRVTISRGAGRAAGPTRLDPDRATLRLGDAGVGLALDRRARTAEFTGPWVATHDLVHPYLGPVATVFGRWLGRESYHAGAFAAAGRAWAITGPKEAGKSTLLAALAGAGYDVLADDLMIVDREMAFAGPRALDLRRPPVAPLSEELPCTVVRGGERWRLALGGCPPAMPLGGWIYLAWGERLQAEALSARERLALLAARRGWPRLRSEPEVLLTLACLPAWRVTRPRCWDALVDTVALLGALAREAPGRSGTGEPYLVHEQRGRRERAVA